jgi:hypothetical protein
VRVGSMVGSRINFGQLVTRAALGWLVFFPPTR